MVNIKKQLDKKRLIREMNHLTCPPRMEGVVKNKMMNPVRKKKKAKPKEGSKR